MGRPRKLTAADKAEILSILAKGGSRGNAADIVGCDLTTIHNEAKRDSAFFDSLKKAEGNCELFHVARVAKGKPGWQSSAWMLERKWWRKWSRRDAPAPSESSGQGEKTIQIRLPLGMPPMPGKTAPDAKPDPAS